MLEQKMKILLSNDDGYLATGIKVLERALSTVADVTVVAPDSNRSGASHALTLDKPLRRHQISDNCYCLDGTPTDCVHMALTGLLPEEPDMVIAGINAGANLGDDVLYSGTVAAAMEGRFIGKPMMAVSLNGHTATHFDTAAWVVKKLLKQLVQQPLPVDTILNVNVPDVPIEAITGFEVTRLGHRHKADEVMTEHDPRGLPMYWIGPAGLPRDKGKGTDFDAIARDAVSITPLQVDITAHDRLDLTAQWLQGVTQ